MKCYKLTFETPMVKTFRTIIIFMVGFGYLFTFPIMGLITVLFYNFLTEVCINSVNSYKHWKDMKLTFNKNMRKIFIIWKYWIFRKWT